MSMTEEKSCEKKIFNRKYTWKKEWVRPYESLFGIMLNFCKINAMEGNKAEKLLKQLYMIHVPKTIPKPMRIRKNKNKISIPSYYGLLLPHWYNRQMNDFYSIWNVYQITEPKLYYCPECMKMGYHSFFHQIINAKKCLFHDVNLIVDESSGWTDGDISRIVYNTSSLAIKNARNIIHPCLRLRNNIIYHTIWLQGKYKKLVHYVSMDHYSYVKIRKELHFPYEFIAKKKYGCHIVVKHWFKSYDELIEELLNNEKMPDAIRLYNQNEKPPEDEWYHSEFKITGNNVTEYYLYCKCMNFTRAERLSDNDEMYVSSEDVIYEGDIPRLKSSFIWAIKDSMSKSAMFSTHWILHPYSADNNNYRHIFNGIHLEYVEVHNLDEEPPFVNNRLASIYIIEDMFEQLWRQYRYLSKRSCGVSVWDSWKELIIPEYFIGRCIDEDGFEIFRLDPVFPGYRWIY